MRKPYREKPGYFCGRRNRLTGDHVVIFDAGPGEGTRPLEAMPGVEIAGRWVVACMAHDVVTAALSQREAREMMKAPAGWCPECGGFEEGDVLAPKERPEKRSSRGVEINTSVTCSRCGKAIDFRWSGAPLPPSARFEGDAPVCGECGGTDGTEVLEVSKDDVRQGEDFPLRSRAAAKLRVKGKKLRRGLGWVIDYSEIESEHDEPFVLCPSCSGEGGGKRDGDGQGAGRRRVPDGAGVPREG